MDELLREVQAEKEYLLNTFRALNEALQRKEKTVVDSLPDLWKDFEFEIDAFINSLRNNSSSSE